MYYVSTVIKAAELEQKIDHNIGSGKKRLIMSEVLYMYGH